MTSAVYLRAVLIALAGILVYSNGLSGPFLFDDQSSIVSNPNIRSLWPPLDALTPPADGVLANRPIVNVSFAINYAIGGLSVPGYHVGNIGLHIAATLILFLLVRVCLRNPPFRDDFGQAGDAIATAAALVWLLHPLQTEAVNYVTQRTELLMGLCYLLTLYGAIRALHSPSPGQWHLAAVVSCLIGAGSKESIATAPLIVILYDRLFVFTSLKEALRDRRVLYAGLALSWVELAVIASSRNHTAGFTVGVSVWTYLLNQTVMITQYLKLTVWPFDLVLDYGMPRAIGLLDVLPEALFIVTLLILTIMALVRMPAIGFCGAWFFLTLAPTSSFIPILTEVGAERRMYLPLAGIVVLGVAGGYWLTARTRSTALRLTMTLAVAGLVVWLAFGTIQRNRDFASSRRVLETSVVRWPHGRARFNLAHVLRAEGKRDEAMVQLRAATVDNPQAQYLLASDLYDRGEFDEAILELRSFIGRTGVSRSDRVSARNLVALALGQQGQYAAAGRELQSALSEDPDNPDLHGNLAFVLLQIRDFEGARVHYEAHLRRREGSAFILTGLGTALVQLGRSKDAGEAFRSALEIDPHHAEARAGLQQIAAE